MIKFDHIAIQARDVVASARFLSEILGVAEAVPDGPDGEMYWLAIGDAGALLYVPTESVANQHIAFRLDERTFAAVLDKLRAKGLMFGNDPENLTNMETSDCLGGHGRVYFCDPDGHLFEVSA